MNNSTFGLPSLPPVGNESVAPTFAVVTPNCHKGEIQPQEAIDNILEAEINEFTGEPMVAEPAAPKKPLPQKKAEVIKQKFSAPTKTATKTPAKAKAKTTKPAAKAKVKGKVKTSAKSKAKK